MASKTAELRNLDIEELENKLNETRQELFNLRFQLVTGQLDNNSRISLTGQCLEVYVIGDDVSLTFENAASIQVVGARAKVEGTSALQEFRQLGDHGRHRLGAITKELYLQGANNELAVESAAELRVTGDNNRVGWRAGNPSIDDIGNGNRLQPAQ